MKRLVILLLVLFSSVSFAFAQSDKVGVSLFPVPLKSNELTVQMKGAVVMRANKIELRNFIGKKLQEVNTEGKNEVQFAEMRQYPEGIYVVLVKDKNGKIVQSVKFLISK